MKITRIGAASSKASLFLESISLKHKSLLKTLNHTVEPNVSTINLESEITSNEKQLLNEIFKSENSLIFLENFSKDNLPDDILFKIDGKTAVVTILGANLEQHILLLEKDDNSETYPIILSDDNISLNDKKGEFDVVELTNNLETEEQKIESENDLHVKNDLFIISTAIEWHLNKVKNFTKLPLTTPITPINKGLATGSFSIVQKNWKSKSYHKKESANCCFYLCYDIELAAVDKPYKAKTLRMTSVESFVSIQPTSPGSPTTLIRNNDSERGDATQRAYIILYPGDKYSVDKNNIAYPEGWSILEQTPKTRNLDTTYSVTSGWEIGASASAGIEDGKPKGELIISANIKKENQKTETYSDFEVFDTSTNLYIDKQYRLEKLARDKDLMFDIGYIYNNVNPLPALSYSTMYVKNEVIYKIPANQEHNQRINILMHHFTFFAKSLYASIYYHQNDNNNPNWHWNSLYVNLNYVSH